MVAQIPMLRKKFPKHADYAGKMIDQIFDKAQLESATVKNAYEFRSCMFINKGDGKFEKQQLPVEAQFSPIFAILIKDFDKDGWKDMLLAGNLYGLKPELGRYDANYGIYYKGLPNHNLQYISPANSRFFYKGEARAMISIKNGTNKGLIILGLNNDSLRIFKNNTDKVLK